MAKRTLDGDHITARVDDRWRRSAHHCEAVATGAVSCEAGQAWAPGLREVCERYGVARLEVFGSVGRGEDGPDSDVDLLYGLKPDARSGFAFFDLEDEPAALFGRPVDLVSRDGINNYLREAILADAQAFYAA